MSLRLTVLSSPTTRYQSYKSELLVSPFVTHRDALREHLGVHAEIEIVSDPRTLEHRSSREDLLLFSRDGFVFSPEIASREETLEALQIFIRKPRTSKLLFAPLTDSTEITRADFLPYVDLFIVKYREQEFSNYKKVLPGPTRAVSYLLNLFEIESVSDGRGLTPEQLRHLRDKIALGWDCLELPKFRSQFAATPKVVEQSNRTIDLMCSLRRQSAGRGPQYLHRLEVVENAHALTQRLGIQSVIRVSNDFPLDKQSYHAQLAQAKIAISPFSHGENNFRDFESAIAGTTLVKPWLGGVESHPQFFEPGITFAAIRPDLLDFDHVCESLIRNENLRTSLSLEARRRVEDYYFGGGFIKIFGAILKKLGVASKSKMERLDYADAPCR